MLHVKNGVNGCHDGTSATTVHAIPRNSTMVHDGPGGNSDDLRVDVDERRGRLPGTLSPGSLGAGSRGLLDCEAAKRRAGPSSLAVASTPSEQ